MNYKTWDEFWALFLQVTFHQNNPERWSVREKRALWCQAQLSAKTGDTILNVGCGDGLVDICLSRLGIKVTAVDRNHFRDVLNTRKVASRRCEINGYPAMTIACRCLNGPLRD